MNLDIVKEIIENNDFIRFAQEWYCQKENNSAGNLGKWRDFDNAWRKYRTDNLINNQRLIQPKNTTTPRTISIFSASMNRLDEVKETLPHNLDLCERYGNCEFVLLDYNSKDKTREWVINNIDSPKLRFYRTEDREYFELTHSFNAVAKLTNGEVITSLPIDNFIHEGFLEYIDNFARISESFVLIKRNKTKGGITMKREDFISLGGYDEQIVGYGAVTYDLYMRAIESGLYFAEHPERYRTSTNHNHKKNKHYSEENKAFKHTNNLNKFRTYCNLMFGNLVANKDKDWGKASLV